MADDPAMEAVLRSFLLGTARHPLPQHGVICDLVPATDPARDLTALALAGQRLRLRRHGPPPPLDPPRQVADPRALVPDPARPLIRRLVGKEASDLAALALADACDRRKLRPHPFDLPWLEAFVAAHAEALGAAAAAWAARHHTGDEPPGDYFEPEAITAANWTAARPAARAAFISDLRRREPGQARALVEASLAAAPAPLRARLVEALAPGLSAADAPFLESLARDRAPSVRDAAQRLVDAIPGSAQAASRLRDLVSRISVTHAGVLRRRTVLALEPPADLPGLRGQPAASGRRWAVARFAGVGLDAIAAALDLAVTDLIAAARDDAALLALIAREATVEARFDVVAAITRAHLGDAWTDVVGAAPPQAPGFHDPATRARWVEAAIIPRRWAAPPGAADLERLYRFLRAPLPAATAAEVLRCGLDGDAPAAGAGNIAHAALMPATHRAALRAVLAAQPPEQALRAILLLDCLALIDPPDPGQETRP